MSKQLDYYQILGVDKTDSIESIKKKYLKLAVKFHPDKNEEDTTTMFEMIQESWATLGNKKKREDYDKNATKKSDHFNLKHEFENYIDIVGKDVKKPSKMVQFDFDKISAEMDKKIGYNKTNEQTFTEDDLTQRHYDKNQEREQQEIEYCQDKLFDDTKPLPINNFNAVFDEYLSLNKSSSDIDLYKKGPIAFNFSETASFSGLDENENMDETNNLNFDEKVILPKNIKNIDLNDNMKKYSNEKLNANSMSKLMKDRENETHQLSQLKLGDFIKPDPCDLLLQLQLELESK